MSGALPSYPPCTLSCVLQTIFAFYRLYKYHFNSFPASELTVPMKKVLLGLSVQSDKCLETNFL
jgi:hypothetical protein